MRETAGLFDFPWVCYFCNTSCLLDVRTHAALSLFPYKL
jgi:hypothetical protein